MGKQKDNVLVIGDTHFPFEQEGYLDFCLRIKKENNCNKVVHIGDLSDGHAISYHESDPNLSSASDEMDKVDIVLKEWFKAFPKLTLTKGNHDNLVDRKGRTAGLPKRCFYPFRDMWKLPKGWKDCFEVIIDDVLYKHGTGNSGKLAHLNLALANRMSTVMGHCHGFAGIAYTASPRDCIFGMNVGSGVDNSALAFAYGKDSKFKPIVSCGVVFKGESPQIFRMKL
jgi:predicted phosphodiesterase